MQDDDLSGLLPTTELTTETNRVDKFHRLHVPGEASPSIRLVNPIYIYLYICIDSKQ